MSKVPYFPGSMPLPSKKSSAYAQIKSEAGVCLVGKRFSDERHYTGLCSGSVIELEVFPGILFLVTSESIFSGGKEELAKVKLNPCEWNDKVDYVLCFKSPKKGELETFKLDEVSTSNERMIFSEGLVIIPLDFKKLTHDFRKYRPFKANLKKLTDSKPFDDSSCRIVKGNTESFMVESYKIEYVNGKECVLSRAGSRFDTLSRLTANGAFPSGAGIFKGDVFTGVLNVTDDQSLPVPFWQGAIFGGKTEEPESSDTTLEGDKPGQAGELDEPGNHDTKVGNNKTDQDNELIKQAVCSDLNSGAESSNSSLDKGECKDGNAIPRESSTKDGKLFSGGNSDERESAHEVNAQLEGSEAGFIKETDPYEGTGACPKRSKQGNSRNAETSSSKETLAGETDETEILSVQESAGSIEGANRKAPTESRRGSLTVNGSKNGDVFPPEINTTGGKLPRDGNTKTLAEEKNIPLKDETKLPIQESDKDRGKQPRHESNVSSKENPKENLESKPGVENDDEMYSQNTQKPKVAHTGLSESSKSSLPNGGSREEDAIFSGRSTVFGEIPGQGGSKIAFPNRNNGASASADKGKGKQPRQENKVSVENGKLRVALKELSVTRLDNNDNAKGTQDHSKTPVENEDLQNGTGKLKVAHKGSSEFTVEGQANGRDESDNNSDGNRGTPSIEGQESQITQIKRRRKSETPPDSPTIRRDASPGSRETQRKEPSGKATGVDCNFWVSNEVAIVFLVAVVVIAVVLLIAFLYDKNKLASCSGAEQL